MRCLTVQRLGIVFFLSAVLDLSAGDIIAAWDSVPDVGGSVTVKDMGAVAADISASIGWSSGDWARSARGSSDGTFGTVPGAVKSVSNLTGALLTQTNGYLDFSLKNTGACNYQLTGFHFDIWRAFNKGAGGYTVSIVADDPGLTNHVAAVPAGTLVSHQAYPVAGSSDYTDDIDISLAGLSSSVLKAGESVTFRLQLVGSAGGPVLIDNIAITAKICDAVP